MREATRSPATRPHPTSLAATFLIHIMAAIQVGALLASPATASAWAAYVRHTPVVLRASEAVAAVVVAATAAAAIPVDLLDRVPSW